MLQKLKILLMDTLQLENLTEEEKNNIKVLSQGAALRFLLTKSI